jgi:4-amino-4-deoxy-L-arabinose transferase-like glycosyltransferase
VDTYDVNKRQQTVVFGLLVVIVFLYFFRLGYPAVWNPNEAFYAETPREMLEHSDFLTPFFNYEHRFQKPPLMYWLVLPWYALMGVNEYAVRMVSAVSAVLCVILTYWLGAKVRDDRLTGLISAVVLAAAFDLNSAARYASPEMLLTMLFTASLAAFYKGYTERAGRRGIWYLLFYALCGLSTLAKGPVGLLLPVLIIVVFFLAGRDVKGLREFVSIRGVLIYLVIAVPWYIYMLDRYGNEFYAVVFGENVTRFLQKKSGTSSPFFYFTVLPWNFLPGSVFIIPAFMRIRRDMKASSGLLFPVVWFGVVFVFFSLSRSKLPPYIYPLFPALAVIVSSWIRKAAEEGGRDGAALAWLSVILPVAVVAGLVWFRGYLPRISILFIAGAGVLVVVALLAAARKTYYVSFSLAVAAMALFYLTFLAQIAPQIEDYRSYREIAAKVAHIDEERRLPVYCFNACQQNLTFYLKRRVEAVGDEASLRSLMADGRDALFLVGGPAGAAEVAGRSVLWRGPFYTKSESRFMRFLRDIKDGRIEEAVLVR